MVKAFRRPPIRPLPVRLSDRNGGFPRLSDGPMLLDGAQGLRCLVSPRHALLAENLGKPSLWVISKDLWYYILNTPKVVGSMGALSAAEMPRPSAVRVSSGSMMPSSHSRAEA